MKLIDGAKSQVELTTEDCEWIQCIIYMLVRHGMDKASAFEFMGKATNSILNAKSIREQTRKDGIEQFKKIAQTEGIDALVSCMIDENMEALKIFGPLLKKSENRG